MMSTNTAGNLVYPIRPKDLERVKDLERIASGEISAKEYQLRYAAIPSEMCRNGTLLIKDTLKRIRLFREKNRVAA